MAGDARVKILLNKAHYPVTVLGPGSRAGMWLQGCTIRCLGCISRDTWAADPKAAVEVESVLDWVRSLPPDEVDGVTISGGEPFDQPDALAELLRGLRGWRETVARPIDLLCFSGRSWADLQREFPEMLTLLDAVVPEPFVQAEPTGAPLRGSANQRVVALSDLGRERYTGTRELNELASQRARIQVEVDDESIWFIGIPLQGDMRKMEEQAAEAGIRMRRTSWLT